MSENGYIGSRFPKIESSKMTDSGNRVVVRLHHAYLSPAIAEAVSRSLECTTKDFFLGGPFGLRSKSKRHAFYVRDADGYIRFHAGLVPRVIDELSSVGIDAQIDDRSRWPVLEQLVAQLPDIVNDENRCLLNAVAVSPRGQIVANVRDHLKLVILICRVFAIARVLIVTPNREQRDTLLAKLNSSRLNRPVSTHGDIPWSASNRVTVMTSHSFTCVSRINNDFDVIVFVGPDTATGDQAFETAAHLNNELLYCLVPPQYHPDELTQLRLEAICGAVIYDDIAPAVAVQVVMMESPSIRSTEKLSPLERKRTTIWHNERRNNLIAEIALAIASQDVSTFSHRGGFLPEHIDLLSQYPNPGIAIVVESTEHGRELQRRLPGWTLHTAIADQDGVLDSGSCREDIVTAAFASVGIHADVLIRATGTGSPLVVKGFPAIGHRRASLLVDLADDFDDQARRNTEARIRDYQSRGWSVQAGNELITNQNNQAKMTQQSKQGA